MNLPKLILLLAILGLGSQCAMSDDQLLRDHVAKVASMDIGYRLEFDKNDAIATKLAIVFRGANKANLVRALDDVDLLRVGDDLPREGRLEFIGADGPRHVSVSYVEKDGKIRLLDSTRNVAMWIPTEKFLALVAQAARRAGQPETSKAPADPPRLGSGKGVD